MFCSQLIREHTSAAERTNERIDSRSYSIIEVLLMIFEYDVNELRASCHLPGASIDLVDFINKLP